ncbi:XTP/dITP diphosphatase [Moritella viscosa]|uniref:dITP/XTP pyrophosphatase n=1 Tax=Moritella viscosa TaxID=80854 RepID=A0A090INB0_9GAMM|nr:XTP/dITP diphosphatase [Moritella viscosa]CED61979.1 nucleoside-triphosphatase rdgB [Moritella viscosa]SGY91733.1 Nucleoside-triphosphatase-Nucleoside triphosphate phosphohydrolase [Moritella viscosa]SGY95967.1 Nucleoside-triphosphatase-Nucleoside triphosphate phosphohydrolase [Moritella viscosa]SGY96396.1 Nucleoside-triphosphatase-Nucleoside triphosphate phosphohydrolase [Moritella viscosa]SGZ01445.1 Nucleoside-triphosphatase-Nucleoside triphosphate phosphohydrolase [Moritella viscosa]
MSKVVLATGNPGKVREMSALLAEFGLEVLPQSNFNIVEADETGTTFIENAIIKAKHAAALTGLPAIADDSGLAVDALQGVPGIYSARYAGVDASDRDNLLKLLDALKDVPAAQRTARFHCVLVYMTHAEDPTPLVCHGSWDGVITEQPSGEDGFGYDPIFFVESEGCTSAELTKQRKSELSHRGQALTKLLAAMHEQQTRLAVK